MTVGQLIRKGLFGVLNSGNEDSVISLSLIHISEPTRPY